MAVAQFLQLSINFRVGPPKDPLLRVQWTSMSALLTILLAPKAPWFSVSTHREVFNVELVLRVTRGMDSIVMTSTNALRTTVVAVWVQGWIASIPRDPVLVAVVLKGTKEMDRLVCTWDLAISTMVDAVPWQCALPPPTWYNVSVDQGTRVLGSDPRGVSQVQVVLFPVQLSPLEANLVVWSCPHALLALAETEQLAFLWLPTSYASAHQVTQVILGKKMVFL